VLRADHITVDELLKEWLTDHAAVNLSDRCASDAVGWWDREIATRHISRVRLARIADDPGIITRFQDELFQAGPVRPASAANAWSRPCSPGGPATPSSDPRRCRGRRDGLHRRAARPSE
jgi:hypothetical protein